jgi:hypothetical protein
MIITPKNWHTFQHYNKRNPPWIKLHRALLDDYDFSQLPVESRALAPMLWLIASESKDGLIRMSIEALAFRLRMPPICLSDALEPLMAKGFFLDASTMLADRLQGATPETETETEKEKRPHPGPETNGGTRTHRGGAALTPLAGGKHSRIADMDQELVDYPFGRGA